MGFSSFVLAVLEPAVVLAGGFLIGWTASHSLVDQPLLIGLATACGTAVLRCPLRPGWPTPASWHTMVWTVFAYNFPRHVLMTGICAALFWGPWWMQVAGGVVLGLFVLVKYTGAMLFQETERTISCWANGYFISGSLALAGGFVLHSHALTVGGGMMILLYWYACCLGYCGRLSFFFDMVDQDGDPPRP